MTVWLIFRQDILALWWRWGIPPVLEPADLRQFLNPAGPFPANYLESAAFVFHMRPVTLRIIRSLRAACSDPVLRFLACPFS